MRTKMVGVHSLLASAAIVLGSAQAIASDITSVSASDYYHVAYYKQALEHPRIQKLANEKARVSLIARDMKVPEKELRASLEKVGSLPGDPIDVARASIESGLGETRVRGRVLEIVISNEEPKHVVAYVRWRGSSSRDVVKEAAAIASIISARAPLVSTLSLAAIHPRANDGDATAVWSGKISHESMARIQPRRIDDYGDRLYAPLFEGVATKAF